MPFSLDQVVPWGRSFDEYVRMFALSEQDLRRRILGCADGPACFNAELTRRGGSIVSCDPLYAYDAPEIEARIDACFATVLDQTRASEGSFVWSEAISTVEALGQIRRQAMQAFLDDYPTGKPEGRYVAAELPELPLASGQFDLALCSHFLFLYDLLGHDFHVRSVRSLLNVANDVRIFPLSQLDGQRSPFVDAVVAEMKQLGHAAEVVPVPYEFQKGANEMLVIRCRHS